MYCVIRENRFINTSDFLRKQVKAATTTAWPNKYLRRTHAHAHTHTYTHMELSVIFTLHAVLSCKCRPSKDMCFRLDFISLCWVVVPKRPKEGKHMMPGVDASFMSQTHTHTYYFTHAQTESMADGSFTFFLTKIWHTASTQCSLMWKPYCMWCVSMNVWVPFSLCGECVMRWQKPPFSNSAFMNYWLWKDETNITPLWNNSVSLIPSPASFAVFLFKLHTQSTLSHLRLRSRRQQAAPLFMSQVYQNLICYGKLWCFTYGDIFKFCCKREATNKGHLYFSWSSVYGC